MERSFLAAVQTQNGPDNRPVLRFMLLLFTAACLFSKG